MRIFIVIACLVAIQGCSVKRVNVDTIQPNSEIETNLPVNAAIMIYVPKAESNKKIMMLYGYGEKHLHEPGEDLKKASLAVAKKYFKESSELSLDKGTHYILKLTGEAKLDPTWGVYTGKVSGKLYASNGDLIYESTVENSTISTVVNDENAFFNSYVNAVMDFFDELFSNSEGKIIVYASTNSKSKLSLRSLIDRDTLELVSTGSGFFINEKGQVITNKHVIADCLAVSVSVNGNEKNAAIIYSDEEADVSILDTKFQVSNYASFSALEKNARLGQEIITIGYPLHGVLSSAPSLTTGNVSSLTGLKNDKSVIQITAPIQPGNSGGPLLDKSGNIVGVVQSKLNALRLAQYTGDIAQNVNFAINQETITNVLDKGDINYRVSKNLDSTLTTPDIADSATRYTVQVMCRG